MEIDKKLLIDYINDRQNELSTKMNEEFKNKKNDPYFKPDEYLKGQINEIGRLIEFLKDN